MKKPLRVLIVEDSEDDALLLIRKLKEGGYEPEYERVETDEAMRTALREKGWDVILCDFRMPQFSGFAAIALLKESGFEIPLIIVSGAIGEETAVECMRHGAYDYVMKSNLSRLAPSVERELLEADSRIRRRQAEETLITRERSYRTLAENLPGIVYRIHVREKGRMQFFNSMLATLTGYDARELEEGQVCLIDPLIVAEDRDRILAEVNAAIGDARSFDLEYRITHKDGTLRFFIERGRPIFDQEGLLHIDGIIQDITAYRRAEEDLRQAEERYRSIFENAQEGIYRATREGDLILANPAMAKMLGYDTSEQVMACITDMARQLYVHPEDREKVIRTIEEQGFLQSFETRFYRKDGSIFWVSLTVHAVRDPGGRLCYYEGISEDITERKNGVERLRKSLGATIQAIAVTVETRDPYTAGHQRRVADLARVIAMEMGLPADQVDGIRMAAVIHDLGKISVPAEILSKPTRITALEFNLIKTHAQAGYDILKDIDFPWPIARIVLEHHERMDGSGYPNGLAAEEILLESRILAVADVVESIASHRPYRPALGIDAALLEIDKNRGRLYDDRVVEVCLRLFREKGFQLKTPDFTP